MIAKKFILHGLLTLEIRGNSSMEMGFNEIYKAINSELLEKAIAMEKTTDFKELDFPVAKMLENKGRYESQELAPKKLDPGAVYDIDGEICETDDNGDVYKVNNILVPSMTYKKNGTTYTTDEKGRIVKWNADIKYDSENERDIKAQTESGGDDRTDGDDGGHLVARILGGSGGSENIVPMRETVNRGDYKKSENEMVEAKKENKEVRDRGEITYEGDSTRPSKIEREYTIEEEKRVLKIDNVKGSCDLPKDIKTDLSKEDWKSLNDEISDMQKDGNKVSVTSVLKKYNRNGELVSTRVGIRNETTCEKSYRSFEIRKEGGL